MVFLDLTMNITSKNLDFVTKQWGPFRRRSPALFRLASSDYLHARTTLVRTAFSTCNFLMNLDGDGQGIQDPLYLNMIRPEPLSCQP